MRYVLMASVAVLFALAGAPKASALDSQISTETNADGSSPYTDADDALEDSASRGGGFPAYQFEMPRFGSGERDASDHNVPWDAERRRLVFGPFNDQLYPDPSTQQ